MNAHRFRDLILIFGAALGMAGLAWLAGFATALYVAPSGPPVPADIQAPRNFGLYGEVWRMVDHEFYGKRPSEADVTADAIEGMVDALGDPFSAYVNSDDGKTRDDAFAPRFVGGLGAWIEPVADGALILATPARSPAAKSLLPGDTIVAVGEDELAGMGTAELVAKLAGTPGAADRLIVLHDNDRGEVVEIKRETVPSPAVELRRPEPGVAYIRLPVLNTATVRALDAALASLATRPATALLLDLRDNPGGDVTSIRAAAGRFMGGVAWVEVDEDGAITEQAADDVGAPGTAVPDRVIVLVNAGTSGGAEILAGALHDNRGAKLVGQSSFGKGSLQTVTALSDRSRIRLTTGHWRTPAGSEVEGVGLRPDLDVAVSDDDRDAGRDPQLDAALATARGEAVTGREGSSSGG